MEELEPLRANALEGHPWAEWAEWADSGSADASGQHTNTLLGPAGAVATVTLSGVASRNRSTDGTPGLGNGASITTQWQGSAALLLTGLLAAAGLARHRRSVPPAA